MLWKTLWDAHGKVYPESKSTRRYPDPTDGDGGKAEGEQRGPDGRKPTDRKGERGGHLRQLGRLRGLQQALTGMEGSGGGGWVARGQAGEEMEDTGEEWTLEEIVTGPAMGEMNRSTRASTRKRLGRVVAMVRHDKDRPHSDLLEHNLCTPTRRDSRGTDRAALLPKVPSDEQMQDWHEGTRGRTRWRTWMKAATEDVHMRMDRIRRLRREQKAERQDGAARKRKAAFAKNRLGR